MLVCEEGQGQSSAEAVGDVTASLGEGGWLARTIVVYRCTQSKKGVASAPATSSEWLQTEASVWLSEFYE